MDVRDDLLDCEFASFLRDLGVEDDLEEEVAQFRLHLLDVPRLDGFEQFVRLLDRHRGERLIGLLFIPWAPLGPAQFLDQFDERFKRHDRHRSFLLVRLRHLP